MFSKRLAAVTAALVLCSCSRKPEAALQRLAVLRFENLSGDASLDWMGRGASEAVAAELGGAPGVSVMTFGAVRALDGVPGTRPPAAPGISAELSEALASGATRVLYGQVSSGAGRLRLDASLYDAATQRVVRVSSAAGPVSAGLLPLTEELARQLGDRTRPFGAAGDSALQAYSDAVESPDAARAAASLERAVAADPNFGAAYVLWAQLAAAQRNTAETERILALAAKRGNAVPELERARLAVVAAGLRRNPRESAQALEGVARLTPSDPALWRQLAQAWLSARQYSEAARAHQRVAALQPEDALWLNQTSYAQVYAGDLAGAVETLKRYAQLRPSDPNALDSLGDAYYAFGRFAEAEKSYKDAYAKDPNFIGGGPLLKAAYARLVSGDVAGADGIFSRLAQSPVRARDPAAESRRAHWEYASGRREQALRRMEAYAAAQSGERAAQAYCQLAVWRLSLGDRNRARETAAKAVAGAGPATAGAVALTRILTDPPDMGVALPRLLERMFPDPRAAHLRNLALIYSFLFAGEYAKALPLLRDAYEHTPPSPEETLPVLLAWAQLKTGHAEEAGKLLARIPVPSAQASDLFASLAFPRYFVVKADVLGQRGQQDEAARNYRLFLQLSGSPAEIFGDEARARQALGGG